MCPVCLTTAALIAGSVTSSGGLAAIVIGKLGGKKAVDDRLARTSFEVSRKESLSRQEDSGRRDRREFESKERSR
jgi:hypothetical protein